MIGMTERAAVIWSWLLAMATEFALAVFVGPPSLLMEILFFVIAGAIYLTIRRLVHEQFSRWEPEAPRRVGFIVLLLVSAASSAANTSLNAMPIDTARYLLTITVVMAIGYFGLLHLMGITETRSDPGTVALRKGES